VLSGTDPLVWRRIQVPERYSFWDLHVAIQDAMGWLDYHLHEFRLLDAAERSVVSIGIPTDDDRRIVLSCLAGKCPCRSSSTGGPGTPRPRCTRMTSATTGNTCSCMRASSQPMTTAAIRVVSPAKARVRPRTVVASMAMPSFSRSWLIPIMRITSRPTAGMKGTATLTLHGRGRVENRPEHPAITRSKATSSSHEESSENPCLSLRLSRSLTSTSVQAHDVLPVEWGDLTITLPSAVFFHRLGSPRQRKSASTIAGRAR